MRRRILWRMSIMRPQAFGFSLLIVLGLLGCRSPERSPRAHAHTTAEPVGAAIETLGIT